MSSIFWYFTRFDGKVAYLVVIFTCHWPIGIWNKNLIMAWVMRC